ncbi:MAG: DUF6048 family protein [Bacteroidota bacterium]
MMLTRNILKYSYSFACLLLLFMPALKAQETDPLKSVQEDETRPVGFDGIRVGYDFWNFAEAYMVPPKFEQEIHGDVFISPRTLLSVNLGRTWIERKKNNFIYDAQGSFIKAGIHYNTFPEHNNILAIGGRIGHSAFRHEATNITIPLRDSIWNDVTTARIPEERMNATWLEVCLTMHVEIFANFYLGWSIQGKVMLAGPRDNQMTPYEIPGFGKGNNPTAAGFNYYVSYQIPLKF